MVGTEVNNIVKRLRYNKIYDYSIFDSIENRNSLYAAIKRLKDSGTIIAVGKGLFYKVKKNEKVNNSFKNTEILKEGVEIGPGLYYNLGLIHKKPLERKILTSKVHYRKTIKLFNEKIKYYPTEKKILDFNIFKLIEVVSNKDNINELDEKSYFNYVKKNITNIKSNQTSLKKFKKEFQNFNVIKQKKFIVNILYIDYDFAKEIAFELLKNYQLPNYFKNLNKPVKSRIFVVLNRNIDQQYKYNKEEVQKALLKHDFNKLTIREKSLYSILFKEFDKQNFELLKKDFIFEKKNLKELFITSYFKDDKYIINKWSNYFDLNIKVDNIGKTNYIRSSRISKIRKG